MALSDEATITIATAVITLIGTMFSGVMAYMMAKLNSKAKVAAEDAKDVKHTLERSTIIRDRKLNEISQVGEETKKMGEAVHILVNSSMSEQLKLSMLALQRVAELTKDPKDIAAAKEAERLLKAQEEKQANLDRTSLMDR